MFFEKKIFTAGCCFFKLKICTNLELGFLHKDKQQFKKIQFSKLCQLADSLAILYVYLETRQKFFF